MVALHEVGVQPVGGEDHGAPAAEEDALSNGRPNTKTWKPIFHDQFSPSLDSVVSTQYTRGVIKLKLRFPDLHAGAEDVSRHPGVQGAEGRVQEGAGGAGAVQAPGTQRQAPLSVAFSKGFIVGPATILHNSCLHLARARRCLCPPLSRTPLSPTSVSSSSGSRSRSASCRAKEQVQISSFKVYYSSVVGETLPPPGRMRPGPSCSASP